MKSREPPYKCKWYLVDSHIHKNEIYHKRFNEIHIQYFAVSNDI